MQPVLFPKTTQYFRNYPSLENPKKPKAEGAMSGVLKSDTFRREIDSMRRISRPFMDPSAEGVFAKLSTMLEHIANSHRRT